MGRPCTICVHEQREQIDREIISGLPYRDISGRFELSKSAVERHAGEHLAAAIARSAEAAGQLTASNLVGELRALREVTMGVLEEARSASDHRLALSAIARLEAQAELVGRLAGELVDRQVIEQRTLIVDAQWVRIRGVLLSALRPHPEAAAAVCSALSLIEEVTPASPAAPLLNAGS